MYYLLLYVIMICSTVYGIYTYSIAIELYGNELQTYFFLLNESRLLQMVCGSVPFFIYCLVLLLCHIDSQPKVVDIATNLSRETKIDIQYKV